MTTQSPKQARQIPEVDPVYLLTKLVELETKMLPLAEAITKLEETNEGTLRTKGIKEKLAQAEQNIQANKEAWEKVSKDIKESEARISTTLREAFLEMKNAFNEKIAELTIETRTQKTLIDKARPWMTVISWLVTVAGGIVLAQIITGNWRIIRP